MVKKKDDEDEDKYMRKNILELYMYTVCIFYA